ncbi:MAG: T9SS type A sorting domain-containing protein, partial [Flavobacteriales bacterium]|nr:T9SS type A sorting domain-containing protein [Flavobacteriales bacterium]
ADPQVWRTGPDALVDYPYELGDLGAITQSTATGDNAFLYYYFFYNWTVASEVIECASERIPVTITVVGIEEISEINSLDVFPNPANENLNISLNMAEGGVLQMDLMDISGRTVQTRTINASSGTNTITENVSGLAPGLYQMRLMINGKAVTSKVIIE